MVLLMTTLNPSYEPTYDAPEEEGYYWIQRSNGVWEIAEVFNMAHKEGDPIKLWYRDFGRSLAPVREFKGRWAGPIKPPA